MWKWMQNQKKTMHIIKSIKQYKELALIARDAGQFVGRRAMIMCGGRFPSVVTSSVLLQMLSRFSVQICGSVVQQSSVDLQGSFTGKTHNNNTGTGTA